MFNTKEISKVDTQIGYMYLLVMYSSLIYVFYMSDFFSLTDYMSVGLAVLIAILIAPGFNIVTGYWDA